MSSAFVAVTPELVPVAAVRPADAARAADGRKALRRSVIDASIDDAVAFFARQRFPLPAWAFWNPAEWRLRGAGAEYEEIRRLRWGWDVTDFGSGDFVRTGRTIFTLRNGRLDDPDSRSYAEKVMYLAEGQRSPIHRHRHKREDIICRGGGNVMIALWRAAADGRLSDEAFTVSNDGWRRTVAPGEMLRLRPGESLCVPPATYHQFWAEEGRGASLSMEISTICDDLTDNVFLESGERFPRIEEDAPARHRLCSDPFVS